MKVRSITIDVLCTRLSDPRSSESCCCGDQARVSCRLRGGRAAMVDVKQTEGWTAVNASASRTALQSVRCVQCTALRCLQLNRFPSRLHRVRVDMLAGRGTELEHAFRHTARPLRSFNTCTHVAPAMAPCHCTNLLVFVMSMTHVFVECAMVEFERDTCHSIFKAAKATRTCMVASCHLTTVQPTAFSRTTRPRTFNGTPATRFNSRSSHRSQRHVQHSHVHPLKRCCLHHTTHTTQCRRSAHAAGTRHSPVPPTAQRTEASRRFPSKL